MDPTLLKVWQAVVSGLSIGSIYALIAQGYYVTFITTATLNFGQGEFLIAAPFLWSRGGLEADNRLASAEDA